MSMICARLAVVSAVWKTLRALRALPLVLTAAALLLSAAGAGDAAAQATAQAAEHEVKAAFLYKFISYIEWPPRSFAREDSPLVIGVVDAPAVADELASIVAGRNVNGRGVILRKVERGEALAGVHVLFVGRGTGARAATLLAAARGIRFAHATGSCVLDSYLTVSGRRYREEIYPQIRDFIRKHDPKDVSSRYAH